MSQIVLIRPGLTDYDAQHRIQGSLDLPLNEEGEREIESLCARLAESGIEILYSSSNEPARSTARRLGEALDVPVKELEGLDNCNLGLWQGQKIEEIKRTYPSVYKRWRESPDRVCPPEGEEASAAVARAMQSLARPVKRAIPFGVVVCEPLATLLSCALRREPHQLPPAYCCKERPGLVEVLDVRVDSNGIRAVPVPSS